MKVGRAENQICVEMSTAEARVLLEELAHIRGGAKLYKMRQLCEGIETLLRFWVRT